MLALLRHWADLLDSRFVLPGTTIRFGIDPILALVPGIGTLVSPAFAMLLLAQGVRQRVPKVMLFRMLFNALLDALISMVPLAGVVGDIFWRANNRNLAILESYADDPRRRPARGDYVFVFGIAALFGALIVIPVVVGVWLVVTVVNWLASGGAV